MGPETVPRSRAALPARPAWVSGTGNLHPVRLLHLPWLIRSRLGWFRTTCWFSSGCDPRCFANFPPVGPENGHFCWVGPHWRPKNGLFRWLGPRAMSPLLGTDLGRCFGEIFIVFINSCSPLNSRGPLKSTNFFPPYPSIMLLFVYSIIPPFSRPLYI